jgi:hypothetical protein
MSKIVLQGTQFAKLVITSVREFKYSNKPGANRDGTARKLYYTTAEAQLIFPNGIPMGYTEGAVILTIFENTNDDYQNTAKQPHIRSTEEFSFTELPFEPRNASNSRFVPYGMLGQIKLNLSDINDARARPPITVVAPAVAVPTVTATAPIAPLPVVDTAEVARVEALVKSKKEELARIEKDVETARVAYQKQREAFNQEANTHQQTVRDLEMQKRKLEDDMKVKDGELEGTRKQIVEGLFKRLPVAIEQVERVTIDIPALLQGRNAFLWKVKKTQ